MITSDNQVPGRKNGRRKSVILKREVSCAVLNRKVFALCCARVGKLNLFYP